MKSQQILPTGEGGNTYRNLDTVIRKIAHLEGKQKQKSHVTITRILTCQNFHFLNSRPA